MRPLRMAVLTAAVVLPSACFGGAFGSDYRTCDADADCRNGERCLATRGGNVCVDASSSSCSSSPGRCPDGTTCAPDGACRTTCNVTGGLSCVVGQVCSGTVCVGKDPTHDPVGSGGAGGGGNPFGIGGSGGAGMGAAPAGAAGSDATGGGSASIVPTSCVQAHDAIGCCGPSPGGTLVSVYYCTSGALMHTNCGGDVDCGWSASGAYQCAPGVVAAADPTGVHPRACGL